MNNIVDFFFSVAADYPDNVAIVQKNKQISYNKLAVEVEQTAAYFTKKGISKGDRVLVFMPMGIDLYRIVLALFSIGATAVFLDEWVSKKRMELCCEIADCKGFIGVPKARLFAFFSKELRRIPIKLSPRRKDADQLTAIKVNYEDTALITFTTGSTGRPKAADRTHGFLKEQFDALLDEIQPKVDDVDMPVLPIVLFMNLGVGCTSVVADFKMSKPEKMDVEGIADQIKKTGVNRITASPYFISRLTEKPNEIAPQIEKIFTGGAPVFPGQAEVYNNAFPNTEFHVVYGSTEAEPISSILVENLIERKEELQHGLPVGEVFHKTDLRIIQINESNIPSASLNAFKDMCVGEGETGEIVVSGPHVLKKYFNNEAAFKANKIIVGETVWHRTGDSGSMKGGQLYLTGRCKQLIQKEGRLISPFIIENQLMEIDGVEMGTMLEMNEKLLLVIESIRSQSEIRSAVAHLSFDELIITKIPRDPRHNSKIDYERLRLNLQ
jgi:acyl-CoA synthetase (AMP-forming)/AMP-acid ligase II